jgi:predicted helicase
MTATPKVYGDRAKSKATEAEVILYSMDNEAHFGKEFHRLGFGEAVSRGLLSDYQVVILAIDEAYAAQTLHSVLTDSETEIKLDDAAKLLGCWMGLAKISDSQEEFANDPDPMKTGVIFVNTINGSKEVQKPSPMSPRKPSSKGLEPVATCLVSRSNTSTARWGHSSAMVISTG